ncbi:MAG: site-2 protease family protein [Gammaproteobacteria bacterium]|jgi:Zn-dependent protease|nr:site-2 protease family protein [Gammaproteobacteria bacterium]
MSEIPLIQKIVIYAIPIIFAITVHEVAHGWVASKLGDPTAKILGRLTLNPIKHMDPIGTVVLPLIMIILTPYAFGWAKPVPVDWRNLRQPRRDMALVAVAGPVANLLMLIFWSLFLVFVSSMSTSPSYLNQLLNEMAGVGIIINIVLIALNMLPLPPLDGSRIVAAFLSPSMAIKYQQLERWGLPILIVLIFTGVLGKILGPMIAFMLSLVQSLLTF